MTTNAFLGRLGELPEFLFRKDLACDPAKTDVFLQDGAQDSRTAQGQQAIAVCLRCPARTDCLGWAIRHDEVGIWGGTNGKQRERLKRTGTTFKVPEVVTRRCQGPKCTRLFAAPRQSRKRFCEQRCKNAAQYLRKQEAA